MEKMRMRRIAVMILTLVASIGSAQSLSLSDGKTKVAVGTVMIEGNFVFSGGGSNPLITCTNYVECVASDGVTQKDIDEVLKLPVYRNDYRMQVLLKMAWKLAQPPQPVMVSVPLTTQQPTCPAGWTYYVEYPAACLSNCVIDEHSNTCKNTFCEPKYSCRKIR